MPIDYRLRLNGGNENIGANEKTITVTEVLRTATTRDIAREIHQLNPLIPPQVSMSVLDNFCEAAAQLMSMGYSVVLQSKGKAALRLYPNVKLNGKNINLAKAQILDPEVTELTLENAGDLVSRAGVDVKVKAECCKEMNDLMMKYGVNLQRKDIVERPKILRTTDNGNGGGNGGGTNTGGGTTGGGGNSGNGDDGMS